MPASVRGGRANDSMMNHNQSLDNCSMMSTATAYTVLKTPVEMHKSSKSVHDILKFNLLNSRRKNQLYQEVDEIGGEMSLNGTVNLMQRSRMDTISKSFGTMKGLPRRKRQASVDPSNLSMEHSIHELNTQSTMRRMKYSEQKQQQQQNRHQRTFQVGSEPATTENITPVQCISSSTVNAKPFDTVTRKKNLADLLNEMESVLIEQSPQAAVSEDETPAPRANVQKHNKQPVQSSSDKPTGTEFDQTTSALTSSSNNAAPAKKMNGTAKAALPQPDEDKPLDSSTVAVKAFPGPALNLV